MNREYHKWFSPSLHRDMELLVFGHSGAKVLAFPTRDGRFYEFENLGIIDILRDKIQTGYIQLYCVDSIDQDAFYASWQHPANRIRRHQQFESYLLHEVLPFMAVKNDYPCTIAMGCSLGAFHAANLVFRHPHLFQKLCAFSGRYDLTWQVDSFKDLFDGYYDDEIYYHTPTHYLPQLECHWRLNHLRSIDFVFTIGKEDPFLGNNHYLSNILNCKGIRHSMHEWEGRAHRGSYWRQMATIYV